MYSIFILKRKFVKELGASVVMEYNEGDIFEKILQDVKNNRAYDLVFDWFVSH